MARRSPKRLRREHRPGALPVSWAGTWSGRVVRDAARFADGEVAEALEMWAWVTGLPTARLADLSDDDVVHRGPAARDRLDQALSEFPPRDARALARRLDPLDRAFLAKTEAPGVQPTQRWRWRSSTS